MKILRKILSVIKCAYIRIFVRQISLRGFYFIGEGAKIIYSKNSRITFQGKFKLGNNVEVGGNGILTCGDHLVINPYSRIIAEDKISIGNDVLIARYVSILDHDHEIQSIFGGNFEKLTTSPIKIGNNVWIGDKVTILKGVNIGNNVIIAANSVVTKNFSSNCIVAGVPAKKIKSL